MGITGCFFLLFWLDFGDTFSLIFTQWYLAHTHTMFLSMVFMFGRLFMDVAYAAVTVTFTYKSKKRTEDFE